MESMSTCFSMQKKVYIGPQINVNNLRQGS